MARYERNNPWKSGFNVRKETRRNASQRHKLLDKSDRILFNNDPVLTPKRERDLRVVHGLASTPKSKQVVVRGGGSRRMNAEERLMPEYGASEENNLKYGHVDVDFRRVVHEIYGEHTLEVEEEMSRIGAPTTPKNKKPWSTPLSKREVDHMTIEQLDGHHKKLQVQTNLEYAVGMSRGAAGGKRAVEQLVEEDRKRESRKAQTKIWREHRRRLKQVEMGIPKSDVVRHRKDDNAKSKSNPRPTFRNSEPVPVTMLGADASKPVYGIRRVPDIDDIIEEARKPTSGGGHVGLSTSDIVTRCAQIRQNSAEDLCLLQKGLDDFLKSEMEWEEKRHDLKYVLNSRFEILKKDIDHSVSVGGSDYKYDDMFVLTSHDKAALKRMGNSVKARRKRALRDAEKIRKEALEHMSERRIDLTRQRLGLRAKKHIVTGAQLDEAAADLLKPKAGRTFGYSS